MRRKVAGSGERRYSEYRKVLGVWEGARSEEVGCWEGRRVLGR